VKNKIRRPQSAAQNRNFISARAAAFQILTKIETEKAFSSALLPVYEERLEVKDRALCHEITLGVLRPARNSIRPLKSFCASRCTS
jgi:hypothetical protein